MSSTSSARCSSEHTWMFSSWFFLRFLRYAQRSSSEVQSQLYIALDQEYITPTHFDELYLLAGQINAKVGGFIEYLKSCKQERKTP